VEIARTVKKYETNYPTLNDEDLNVVTTVCGVGPIPLKVIVG
jgi:hypothetical protein